MHIYDILTHKKDLKRYSKYHKMFKAILIISFVFENNIKEEFEMKTSSIKKLLSVVLATTVVAGMSLTAFATTSNNVPAPTATPAPAAVSAPAPAAVEVVLPSTSAAAGVTSAVKGVYLASTGVAITTPSASLGLAAGEVGFVKTWDLKASTSPAAAAAINAIAGTQNAVVGPMVNVQVGKMAGGKFSLLSQDGANIAMAIALPASFQDATANYAVICVRPGGSFTILPAVFSNGGVVFQTTGGQGAYAVIKY